MPSRPTRPTPTAPRAAWPGGARVAWRVAPLLLPVSLLAGCHYASSPLVGFGGFIGNTHTFRANPNLPPGSDENVLRAQGRAGSPEPLLPEGGNIWPGPPPPEPSLSDIQQQQNAIDQQTQPQTPPPPPARGSSTPPALLAPQPNPPPAPSATVTIPRSTVAPPIPPPRPPTLLTPGGPLINNGPVGVPGGVGTATNPVNGSQNIVVPNGNGTSTVISPDGSTQIIPTPR